MKKLCFLFILASQFALGQFSFCEGSKGDPIFFEDFGSGTTYGPALPAGVTNYNFVAGCPNDGSYTIYNSNNCFGWHNNGDHTPNDTNGKHLIVNASYTAGEFYRRTVSGLCENTTYEFSAWLINILPNTSNCANGGIPINVKFQILNTVDNSVLAEADTGNLSGTATPNWNQYALTFTSPPGQTSVILKMINNGAGGCGNDLGIDDIMFRSCGDLTTLTTGTSQEQSYTICETEAPANITMTATPDYSVYTSHAFQWQQSTDAINWNDIAGATTDTYNAININTTTYYRVKIAEDNINLQNALCYTVSNEFIINVISTPNPPAHIADVIACRNETIPNLEVNVGPNQTVDWYADSTGGIPLAEGQTSYSTEVVGTYYAEARSIIGNCTSITRTAVSITINDVPDVEDEALQFCSEVPFPLNAGVVNMQYLWSTGAVTQEIMIANEGEYWVDITTPDGCTITKNFTTAAYSVPVIKKVISNNDRITIEIEEEGDFEFSLDAITYQDSNEFSNIKGGRYFAYVRNASGRCLLATLGFVHLEIPPFFTPNGDGKNDLLLFNGTEEYGPFTSISIFDRYGQMITSSNSINFSWDGTLNGQKLPESDYWYRIILPDFPPILGHFTLKR